VLGARLSEENAVRIDEEVADAALLQNLIDARRVAALRQPDALRALAEMAFELPATNFNLGADGVHVRRHQRQEAVGGAAGDELELARLEESAEAVVEVVVILPDEDIARPHEAVVVHVRELVELRLPF